jgi:methionyl aminopeptidase
MHTLPLRTPTELDAMRDAGRVVAQTLTAVRAAAVPGVRLRELDELAQTTIREAGALPAFLGYLPTWAPTPFNGALCLSPNEIVVHGRPNGRRLREGDLLSIDCGAIADGWHGDSAITVHVGAAAEEDARLLQATELALHAGIAAAVPGATLLDVAAAVDAVARAHGFAHLPDHGGHGIGRNMHEAPFVPNEPTRDAGRHRLRAGNTIAIEPMLHAGTPASSYRTKKDGWSIVTTEGKRAAHVEHTIAVTDDGPEILTAR